MLAAAAGVNRVDDRRSYIAGIADARRAARSDDYGGSLHSQHQASGRWLPVVRTEHETGMNDHRVQALEAGRRDHFIRLALRDDVGADRLGNARGLFVDRLV